MRRTQPHDSATTSGIILASAGIPMAVAHWVFGPWSGLPQWLRVAVALTLTLALLAGLTINRKPRLGRVMATTAMLSTLALGIPQLVDSPFATLLSLVLITGALALLWRQVAPHSGTASRRPRRLYEVS
jgi:hypothetical protein